MPQKIQVFAVMKEYFSPELSPETAFTTLTELRQFLLNQKPEAESVIGTCRFAVNNEFIDENFIFQENDTISIIPPSSGG